MKKIEQNALLKLNFWERKGIENGSKKIVFFFIAKIINANHFDLESSLTERAMAMETTTVHTLRHRQRRQVQQAPSTSFTNNAAFGTVQTIREK